MRISFLSNAPWAPTGYGTQLKLAAPRIKKLGHDLSVQAYYGHAGSPIDWNGIMVYGMAAHIYGQDVMHAHAQNFNADILISNMDAWVIEPDLMLGTKWVAWFPVDSEPCPPLVAEKVKKAFHRIVYTRFAQKEMERLGIDCDYVPNAVDTSVFKPMDRVQARETAHLPQDRYIVGMVAMNKGFPPRKAFYQNIEAFKRFHDKHPDSLLYLHTLDGSRPSGETIDLAGYCRFLGLKIGTDVIFADQYSYVLGYPENALATLYNCMDVHLLVSMGEGFGVPQVEAQACGIPVICGDWTTMGELCFAGWKVERKEAEPFFTTQNAYQFLPHVDAIVDRLEQAYRMRGNEDYSRRAREGALKYDINRVVEKHWTPVLAKIEQKLGEVPADQNLLANLAVLR